MAKTTVYAPDGSAVTVEPIDGREYLASGYYSAEPPQIRVCSDDPQGWRWIALLDFDPAAHVAYPAEATQAPDPVETAAPEKRPVGRPRKPI